MLRDLQARTDGWAASLQLVKTAVDGRSPGQVRAFVSSLSGAEGDLYDYLAEEVVGDLGRNCATSWCGSSILEDIEPETAAVAAGVAWPWPDGLLRDAQRLGLVSRGDDRGEAPGEPIRSSASSCSPTSRRNWGRRRRGDASATGEP